MVTRRKMSKEDHGEDDDKKDHVEDDDTKVLNFFHGH